MTASKNNYKVKIYYSDDSPHKSASELLLRQTPKNRGFWKNIQFFIGTTTEDCDFCVVLGGKHPVIRETIPKKNSLLIGNEPPLIDPYTQRFLNQFEHVICTYSTNKPKNQPLEHQHQGYPWYCGRDDESFKTYDDYTRETTITKTKILSILCSSKRKKSGHKKRFNFVKKLKIEFGDEIDLFGRGQNFISDKSDAIRPYQYHVVIENSEYPDYWTEKLADSYLEGAFPFYSGAPNLDHYFSNDAYLRINLDDFDNTVKTIRQAISNNHYEHSIQALQVAKSQILNEYNLFNLITDHLTSINFPKKTNTAPLKVYPSRFFRKGLLYKLKFMIKEVGHQKNKH